MQHSTMPDCMPYHVISSNFLHLAVNLVRGLEFLVKMHKEKRFSNDYRPEFRTLFFILSNYSESNFLREYSHCAGILKTPNLFRVTCLNVLRKCGCNRWSFSQAIYLTQLNLLNLLRINFGIPEIIEGRPTCGIFRKIPFYFAEFYGSQPLTHSYTCMII